MLALIHSDRVNATEYDHLREQGYVVVSPGGPEDGGDFGPKTAGTKTGGIQEAIDHLRTTNTGQHRKQNLYIAAGKYVTTETIHVPWLGERLRIEARESWIHYLPKTGDVLVIDSQMNGRLRFGYVAGVNLEDGWIVKVQPVDPGPSAPLPRERQSAVIVSTLLEFNAIVAKAYFEEGMNRRGNGLLLDGRQGPILFSTIDVSEVNTCSTGVKLVGQTHLNRINLWFNHGCDVHLHIDPDPMQNRIYSAIHSEGVPGSVGAHIAGDRNQVQLAMIQVADGNGVVFDKTARNNRVHLQNGQFGYTNHATDAANEITSQNGLKVLTPDVPATNEWFTNPVPADVEVLVLDPGSVKTWRLRPFGDTERVIQAPWRHGQQLRLSPGDAIWLDYDGGPPAWSWRAE